MPLTRRETIYQSPVFLTPFAVGGRIDAERLEAILADAFSAAALSADDIDCGVVLLTGAARDRENAAAVTASLAEACGDIVSASAGHHMEARIAAFGSGAVERSATLGMRFLNLDIGGATAKLAICEHGRVLATAALGIGGRLVVTDKSDRIIRLEPAGRAHAARIGLDWEIGGQAPWSERQAVADAMASTLLDALTGKLPTADLLQVSLTGDLPSWHGVSGLIVSGGVGEYVYGRESRSFSDLGLPLGRALASRIDAGALPWPLMPAGACIRATVLGASSHSVQLSGRTGFLSDPAVLLPRRNLPVIRPQLGAQAKPNDPIDAAVVARALEHALSASDLEGGRKDATDIVVALDWQGEPDHARLKALAEGVKQGLAPRLAAGAALYLIVEADIAASLGTILQCELGISNPILVLDGIALADLDYVDLGRLRLPSGTVPLTIKSLVFRDEPGQKATRTGGRGRMSMTSRI